MPVAMYCPGCGFGYSFSENLAVSAWHVGNFDSLLGLLFAPTGVPFAFEYLNFIGGMRNLVLRRS